MKQYCNDNSPINVIEEILEDASLVEIDNTWVLLYKVREYMRLLDAKSREDAEEQIASECCFSEMRSVNRFPRKINLLATPQNVNGVQLRRQSVSRPVPYASLYGPELPSWIPSARYPSAHRHGRNL